MSLQTRKSDFKCHSYSIFLKKCEAAWIYRIRYLYLF